MEVMRQGIVVVSSDPTIVGLVATISRSPGFAIASSTAVKCVALCNGSLRRQLLILDDARSEISVSRIIESVRLVDPDLPIVVVRRDRTEATTNHGVHVVGERALESVLAKLLVEASVPGHGA